MKITNFTNPIMKVMHRVGFWTRKRSPELLLAAGIGAAAGSVILAIRATLKLENTMKESNSEIKAVKERMNDESALAAREYTVKDCKKDLTRAYGKAAFKVVKLYSPAVLTFGLAITSLCGSHKIVKGRLGAAVAAYNVLDNGYKSYRERVAKKIGEKAEREIFRNEYEEERDVTIIDKDGKEKIVKKKIKVPHMNKDSDFTYLFDSSNPEWSKDGRLNLDYLLGKEKYLNQKLISQRYLFLNDVYESIGIEPGIIGERKMQAARILGWIYDPNSDTHGDNYVSFGISDKQGNLTEEAMAMIRNDERDIWLEFNPDGDILTNSDNQKNFMKVATVL